MHGCSLGKLSIYIFFFKINKFKLLHLFVSGMIKINGKN